MIFEEHEKNNKALQEMNTNLVGKDKRIVEMERSVNDLNDKLNGLSSKLDEAKSIAMDVFRSGFNEAMRQSKYFFTNKELNFDLFESTIFLEDIL